MGPKKMKKKKNNKKEKLAYSSSRMAIIGMFFQDGLTGKGV